MSKIEMDKLSKEALQVTKELVVKFIESGRVSPANLGEVFNQTYSSVLETIAKSSVLNGNSDSSGFTDEEAAKGGHVAEALSSKEDFCKCRAKGKIK